ncbi:MAG: hydantoinase B/oxoprolinase family protein, partial [Gammaproteobacteria bacterium]
MDPVDRSLFVHRIQSICAEMGATLRHSALSPNIRDRLDFSCAVFDAGGGLCAQAAHIPVHLGSMAFAMRDIVDRFKWQDGDMIILNDPFLGGTHLPDVTLIAPVFSTARLAGFVANRAHFADIGGATPGSMPLARRLEEEGMVIAPTLLVRDFNPVDQVLAGILSGMRSPQSARADLMAQISANRRGALHLQALIDSMGASEYQDALIELDEYGERLSRAGLESIPDGEYAFQDYMDDDGMGLESIPIRVRLQVRSGQIQVDFTGTADQVDGNINCPLSVAAAAVYYCLYCLMPPETPACAGTFRRITLCAPDRCLVNASPPAAVAAGNVETSSRIVDAILGALAPVLPDRVPAAA